MGLAQEKKILVICGVNKVTKEQMAQKYTPEELKHIEVLDLVSRYGEDASLNRAQECLSHLCQNEVQQMFESGSPHRF